MCVPSRPSGRAPGGAPARRPGTALTTVGACKARPFISLGVADPPGSALLDGRGFLGPRAMGHMCPCSQVVMPRDPQP